MANQEVTELQGRTRDRNDSLWRQSGWHGLLSPIIDQEEAINLLSRPSILSYMAISDEAWEIKESQRDKSAELEQFGVNQDRQIVDMKAATARHKLALQKAIDQYVIAVQDYEAKVKDLIQAARDYAAQVELDLLETEIEKAKLAVQKEELQTVKVNAQIFKEYVDSAMVDADIAKYKVDVAKANVRAILADIEAGEAEIKLINAQIERYTAEAEKSTLQADVAEIWARVMVKRLSQVKLDVNRAEIKAGFKYIDTKLADMVALYDEKDIISQIKIDLEADLLQEMKYLFEDQKAAETLQEQKVLNDYEVFDFTQKKTQKNIEDEAALLKTKLDARLRLLDAKKRAYLQEQAKKTWAQVLINDAHRYVYKNLINYRTDVTRSIEYIEGS